MKIISPLTKWFICLFTLLSGTYLSFASPCASAPATPAAFTTYNASVCQGASGVVYTVPTVTAATSYTWSYSGTGGAFTSTTNSVTINYSSSATSGILSVTANGACGSSSPLTLTIIVNAGPVTSVTGNLCTNGALTVSATPSPYSYVWKSTSATVLTSTVTWAANGTTVAGGSPDNAGSSATQLNHPNGVYVDTNGYIYVSDRYNDRIQKFAPGSSVGTTIAGVTGSYGGGLAQMQQPTGVYLDASGNIYVCDQYEQRVTEYPPTSLSGTLGTLVAGTTGDYANPGTTTTLANPVGICVDASGNIYVSDNNNHRIQKWAPPYTSGITVAGINNSAGSSAYQLSSPTGVFLDGSGNMYVSDFGNNRIQEFAPGSTTGITVAGSSTGVSGSTTSFLANPWGVYVDGIGNLYIADAYNNRGMFFFAGSPGTGIQVGGLGGFNNSSSAAANQLAYANGVSVDKNGNFYLCDYNNSRVMEYPASISPVYTPTTAGTYSVITTAFNGCSSTVTFSVTTSTYTATVSPVVTGTTTICQGATTTLTDATPGGVWTSSDITIATVSTAGVTGGIGSGTVAITYAVPVGGCNFGTTYAVITVKPTSAGNIAGNLAVCQGSNTTLSDGAYGGTWSAYNGNATINSSGLVTGVTAGTDIISYTISNGCGTPAYATYTLTVNGAPAVSITDGSFCPGNTATVTATPSAYSYLWAGSSGTLLTSTVNWAVNGITVAGGSPDNAGSSATQLDHPNGVYVDASGNVYVSDRNNDRIQKFVPGSSIGITVAGVTGAYSGSLTEMQQPTGVYVDANGNIFVSDQYEQRITEYPPTSLSGTTGTLVAGTTGAYSSPGTTTTLANPVGVYADGNGNVYVSDNNNHRIQKWAPPYTSGITVAGIGSAGPSTNQLSSPTGVFLDGSGNVYVSDFGNNRIQEFAPGSSIGVTVAGSSIGTSGGGASLLANPYGVYVDGLGNVYIADAYNNRVMFYFSGSPATGVQVGGLGGYNNSTSASASQLAYANGVYLDKNGNIYVCDYNNSRVMEYTSTVTPTFTPTVAGTYSVIVTGFNGCSTTQAFTVGSASVVPAITGTTTVCTGSTTTLSDATSGGIWTSDNTGIATVDASGDVTGTGTGTVSITYSVTTGCGSGAAYTVVTVSSSSPGSISGTYSVCVGATTALTDAGSSGAGTWSSSDLTIATVSTAGIVHGIGAGTANISYSISGGCGTVSTYSAVTVNPLPLAGTISGSVIVCIGSSITLSDAGGTGTGTWISGNTGIATVSASGVAGGIGTGTVAITYSVTNGCGSASTFTIVTVNASSSAGAITGTTTVCPGFTTLLTDAGSTGSGTWSSSDASIASVNSSGTVTGITSGSANISYSVSGGCGSASTYSVVTVSPAPTAGTISGMYSVCPASTTTLTDAGSTASGTWSSSDVTIATVDASGNVHGLTAGTTNISYSISGGCGAASTYSAVTVNPLPVAGTISGAGTGSVCTGSTITLTDAGSSGTGTWTTSNSSIATVDVAGDVTGTGAGTVTVTYSVTNTCGSASTFTVVTVNSSTISAGVITGTMIVCQGLVTALNDAGSTVSGTWSSSDLTVATVDAAGNVYGVAAGTANISYSISEGCGTASTYSAVTVNPLPVAGSISGPGSVCAGAAILLTDGGSTGTGTWSSDATGTATVDASGNVTGIGSGTADITFTAANSCGSDSTSVTVTVNNIPLVIAGTTTTICTGSFTTLTASGATTYSWAPATGISVTTGAAITADPTATITYTVTGTQSGCSGTATETVNVNPIPSISAGTAVSICAGSPATLTASGGTTYSWAPSAGLSVTTGASVTAYPTGTTTYTVMGTASGCSGTATELVTVNTTTTLTASITHTGTNYTLTTDAITYSVYWFVNGALDASFTSVPAWSFTVAPGATDSITAVVIAFGACYNPDTLVTDTLIVVGPPLGVASLASTRNISVYPNPAADNFTVSGCQQGDMISVTNITGKEVTRYICTGNTGSETVSVKSLPSAVYILRVVSAAGDQLSVQKLIKE